MTGQIDERRQKALWRNVNARFPGFSHEVCVHFWDLVERDRLNVDDAKFTRALLLEFPAGIDITDLAQGERHQRHKHSVDSERVSQWARDLYEFHDVIESFLDGDVPIPLAVNGGWTLMDRISDLEKEVAYLEDRVNDLSAENLSEIDELNPKRILSIYKLIIGMARHKYNMKAVASRDSVVTNIENGIREKAYPLHADTIRDILRNADAYIAESSDPLDDIGFAKTISSNTDH